MTQIEANNAIRSALWNINWLADYEPPIIVIYGYEQEFTGIIEPIKKVDGGDNSRDCSIRGDGDVEKGHAKPGEKNFYFTCDEPNADPVDPGSLVLDINEIHIEVPLPPSATPLQAAELLEGAMQATGLIISREGTEIALDWDDPINAAMLDSSVYILFGLDSTAAGGPHWGLILPDCAFKQIPYDWVEINPLMGLPGINTGITGDDQIVGPFPMSFNFPFYDGMIHNSIRVCSNGFATFTSTVPAANNTPIPDPSFPNDLIAPYWDDLDPSSGLGQIWWYDDVANNRFIIEWQGIPHYGTWGSYTFETILYEDGTIDFMYQELTPGSVECSSVGIENSTGTYGLQVAYCDTGMGPLPTPAPQPEMGIRIFPVWIEESPWYNVFVELNYVSGSPVPPGGGNIYFDVYVENLEPIPLDFDAWLDICYMGGPPETVVMRSFTNYLPGWSINRPGMYFPVPGAYAPGPYDMFGRAGIHPDEIWGEGGFPFEKLGEDEVAGFVPWIPDGVPNPFTMIDRGDAVNTTPSEATLIRVHPNPFNPLTTISYQLLTSSRLTLAVYDVSGRKVVDLVNGWRDAGMHAVTFDGSNLASGIYIARLSSGELVSTQKLLLIK
jgi:hypothetical protein